MTEGDMARFYLTFLCKTQMVHQPIVAPSSVPHLDLRSVNFTMSPVAELVFSVKTGCPGPLTSCTLVRILNPKKINQKQYFNRQIDKVWKKTKHWQILAVVTVHKRYLSHQVESWDLRRGVCDRRCLLDPVVQRDLPHSSGEDGLGHTPLCTDLAENIKMHSQRCF